MVGCAHEKRQKTKLTTITTQSTTSRRLAFQKPAMLLTLYGLELAIDRDADLND